MENIKEKNGAVKTIALKKPMADGKTELALDFDKVTGYVLIECEKEAKKEDPAITVQALSMVYKARVAAAASGTKYDDILSLPGRDFSAVTAAVQAFLLDSED